MTGELSKEELQALEKMERDKKLSVAGNILDPAQLRKDAQINPLDLDTAMLKQAGLFAHYATLAAKAQERADNLKLKREVLESKIDQEIRDNAASEGVKITEKMIEAKIRIDVRWIKVQKELNAARAEADLSKSALEALRHKRDMMVQIGVNMREEMKGEMRLKEIGAAELSASEKRERALKIASNSA